jgi:hypothetical protein
MWASITDFDFDFSKGGGIQVVQNATKNLVELEKLQIHQPRLHTSLSIPWCDALHINRLFKKNNFVINAFLLLL